MPADLGHPVLEYDDRDGAPGPTVRFFDEAPDEALRAVASSVMRRLGPAGFPHWIDFPVFFVSGETIALLGGAPNEVLGILDRVADNLVPQYDGHDGPLPASAADEMGEGPAVALNLALIRAQDEPEWALADTVLHEVGHAIYDAGEPADRAAWDAVYRGLLAQRGADEDTVYLLKHGVEEAFAEMFAHEVMRLWDASQVDVAAAFRGALAAFLQSTQIPPPAPPGTTGGSPTPAWELEIVSDDSLEWGTRIRAYSPGSALRTEVGRLQAFRYNGLRPDDPCHDAYVALAREAGFGDDEVGWPPVYVVDKVYVLGDEGEANLRRRGIGTALYTKLAELATRKGALIAAMRCRIGSGTSPAAQALWMSPALAQTLRVENMVAYHPGFVAEGRAATAARLALLREIRSSSPHCAPQAPPPPPDVIGAFRAAADCQRWGRERGALCPEVAMERAQDVTTGLYSNLLEHVGDLTHRLFERWPDVIGGLDKIEYALHRLNSGARGERPFEEEVQGQFWRNAAYEGMTYEAYLARAIAAAELYAIAHETIPVYNRVGYLAREAAVDLGRGLAANFDFDGVRRKLQTLHDLAANGRLDANARDYRLDAAGRLRPYPWRRSTQGNPTIGGRHHAARVDPAAIRTHFRGRPLGVRRGWVRPDELITYDPPRHGSRSHEELAAKLRGGWPPEIPLVWVAVGDGQHLHDGHHRVRAAQAAGLARIPAILYDRAPFLEAERLFGVSRTGYIFDVLAELDPLARQNAAKGGHREKAVAGRWPPQTTGSRTSSSSSSDDGSDGSPDFSDDVEEDGVLLSDVVAELWNGNRPMLRGLGWNIERKLGAGAFGFAFLLQNGLVLKFTTSYREQQCVEAIHSEEYQRQYPEGPGPHFPVVVAHGEWRLADDYLDEFIDIPGVGPYEIPDFWYIREALDDIDVDGRPYIGWDPIIAADDALRARGIDALDGSRRINWGRRPDGTVVYRDLDCRLLTPTRQTTSGWSGPGDDLLGVDGRRIVADLVEAVKTGSAHRALRGREIVGLLGYGADGFAFALADGEVLKITSSPDEAVCVTAAAGSDRGPHFPHITDFGDWDDPWLTDWESERGFEPILFWYTREPLDDVPERVWDRRGREANKRLETALASLRRHGVTPLDPGPYNFGVRPRDPETWVLRDVDCVVTTQTDNLHA